MHNILLLPNFPHISLHGLHLIKPHQTPCISLNRTNTPIYLHHGLYLIITSCRTKWSSHLSHTTSILGVVHLGSPFDESMDWGVSFFVHHPFYTVHMFASFLEVARVVLIRGQLL